MSEKMLYYKTNRFHVTDENAYDNLIAGICTRKFEEYGKPLSQNTAVRSILSEGKGLLFGKTEKGEFIPVTRETADNFHALYIQLPAGPGETENPYVEIAKNADEKGPLHGFSGKNFFEWNDPEFFAEALEIEGFLFHLQKLLPKDECFIYQEISYEDNGGSFSYIDGRSFVVTHSDIQSIVLTKWSHEAAGKLLCGH